MQDLTRDWWTLLTAVAAFNLAAWAASAWWLRHRHARAGAALLGFQRTQLLLSAVYVAGCAWRSALPVFDVPRLVLVDSWWSSVVVGRTVATLAELAFAAQWALLLQAASQATGSRGGRVLSRLLLPMIAVAELFSWYSVLTTANIGHVVEETLWGCGALVLVAGLGFMWRGLGRVQRRLALVLAAGGLVYAAYMFGVDVPMYWARWHADEAQGRVYLHLAQGLSDAGSRWVVSHRWSDWQSEVVWMTLYFSVAVWVSIGLAHAPVHRERSRG
ncbi:MAG: hypothetical protein U1F50_19815 [Rubrivivax sp.]